MPEHSPEPFTNDCVMTFSIGDYTISDSPQRIAACYYACRQFKTEDLIAGDPNQTLKISNNIEILADINRRYVACLNACRGLNPEVVPELVGMVGELRGQLEELIGTIIANAPANEWPWTRTRQAAEVVKKARELLGRVKG